MSVPSKMIPVRMTESDIRTLDAAVNMQKAENAFTSKAWQRVSRSSVIREAIHAAAARLQLKAAEKDKKPPPRRYSERKGRKGKK